MGYLSHLKTTISKMHDLDSSGLYPAPTTEKSLDPVPFKRPVGLFSLPWELQERIFEEVLDLLREIEEFRDPSPQQVSSVERPSIEDDKHDRYLRPPEEISLPSDTDTNSCGDDKIKEDFLEAISPDIFQVTPGEYRRGRHGRRQARRLALLYCNRRLYSVAIQAYYRYNIWTFSSPDSLWEFANVLYDHGNLHLIKKVQIQIQIFGVGGDEAAQAWTKFFGDLKHYEGGLTWFFPGLRNLIIDFEVYYLNPRWIMGRSCELWADVNGGERFDRLIEAITAQVRVPALRIYGLAEQDLNGRMDRTITGKTLQLPRPWHWPVESVSESGSECEDSDW